MTTTTTSSTHTSNVNPNTQAQAETGADPMRLAFAQMPTWATDTMAQMARDHLARVDAFMREMAAMEAAMIARAKSNAKQFAELTQGTLDYVSQLTNEWRTFATETSKQAIARASGQSVEAPRS